MLTITQAVEIYRMKLKWASQHEVCMLKQSMRGMSIPVSKMFGVSPRAIRDIWNRRTWEHATADLWGLETFVEETEASPNEVLVTKISVVKLNSSSILLSPVLKSAG